MIQIMKIFISEVAGAEGFGLAKKYLGRGDSVVGVDDLNDCRSRGIKVARLAELGIRDAESMLSDSRGGDGTFPAPSRFCGKFRFYLCDKSDDATVAEILRRERCGAVAGASVPNNDINQLK